MLHDLLIQEGTQKKRRFLSVAVRAVLCLEIELGPKNVLKILRCGLRELYFQNHGDNFTKH